VRRSDHCVAFLQPVVPLDYGRRRERTSERVSCRVQSWVTYAGTTSACSHCSSLEWHRVCRDASAQRRRGRAAQAQRRHLAERAERSLLGSDFRGGRLPRGPAGPRWLTRATGPAGPTGPSGATGATGAAGRNAASSIAVHQRGSRSSRCVRPAPPVAAMILPCRGKPCSSADSSACGRSATGLPRVKFPASPRRPGPYASRFDTGRLCGPIARVARVDATYVHAPRRPDVGVPHW
jgi:hypothetical protein